MTNKWDIQKHKKVEVFASTSMMLIDDDQTMAKNIDRLEDATANEKRDQKDYLQEHNEGTSIVSQEVMMRHTQHEKRVAWEDQLPKDNRYTRNEKIQPSHMYSTFGPGRLSQRPRLSSVGSSIDNNTIAPSHQVSNAGSFSNDIHTSFDQKPTGNSFSMRQERRRKMMNTSLQYLTNQHYR